MERRQFIRNALSVATVAATGKLVGGENTTGSRRAYRRIACEEGFLISEVVAANEGLGDIGIPLITRNGPAAFLAELLCDIGDGRIAAMERDGIDMQLLMLSAPGLQVFDRDTAIGLAREVNDQVSEACRRHPNRFAALAAMAPQAPERAARELERAVTQLGLKGAIINSHTGGRYLDDPEFVPIFEALQDLRVPLYLHPRDPVPGIAQYMSNAVVDGAAWAYAVEVGTHALRLIGSGIFDRYPDVQIVIGHMGEGLPFWLPRIDNRYQAALRFANSKLELLPSEYVHRNFHITTSGMNYMAPLELSMEVLGIDRLLYASDYPFEKQGEAVAAVEAMPLSFEQKQALFEANAVRVFAL
jgi:2,3-dihydroxybenzoate decarboxylase